MSDAEFKEDLLKFGGIDASKGTLYLRGNARMLGNGSYISQLTVKDMVVTGNAVIPGISFDSLTVAGNVTSTDGNFIGNGALMTGVISTPPPEANINIFGNVVGAYATVDEVVATFGNIGNVRMAEGNMSIGGQVNVLANVAARGFIGNGSRLVGVKVSGVQNIDIIGNVTGNNANVGDITANAGNVGNVLLENGNVTTGGQVNVLGNIVAEYFIGNGANIVGTLPTIANVDIRGNVDGAHANVGNIIATFGNIGNVRIAGGNVNVSGQVNALGTVSANSFIGNGAFLTGITHPPISNMDILGNVTGLYANMGQVIAVSGNIGNVVFAEGSVSVSGQVDVRGNVAAGYIIGNGSLLVGVTVSGNHAIDIRGNAIGEYAHVDDIIAISGNIGNVNMSGGNMSVGEHMTVLGNVTAGYFIGDGSEVDANFPAIAAIDIRGNVSGIYANMGQVIANSGTIGNVTMASDTMRVDGDMSVIGNVATGCIIGNGATLDTADVSGNARVDGDMTVLGNVAGAYFIGNGALLYDIVATGIPSEANADIRGNVIGTYVNVSNITTTFGNIGNVEISNGSVYVMGQVHVDGNVSAGYIIGNNANLSGIYIQPNVDIRGNANGAYANMETIIANSGNVGNVRMEGGNVSGSGNINVVGTMTANCFIGNGSLLTLPSRKRPARYLSIYLSKNQTISSGETWGDKIIRMDTIREGKGIEFFNNGEFTLEAGITYRITAQLTWESGSTSAYFYPFTVYNRAARKNICIPSEALPIGSVANNTSSCVLDIIHTPDVTGVYYLRMGTQTGGASYGEKLRADLGTFLNIEEINDVFLVDLPQSANATIRGNLVGNVANVGNVTARVGNIGNVTLENGNITVRGQVDVLGNVTANRFVGDGSQLRNITLIGNHVIDIRGNVEGNYINVGVVQATIGNIGNSRMENGNVHVRGQVNVLGNVTAKYFDGNGALLTNVILTGTQVVDITGNVTGNYALVQNANALILGNIANVVMEKGNISTIGQVNIVGNITAVCFLGDGSQLINMIASSELQTVDIRGNVKGGNVNVATITAITGNIGNVRMSDGNIVAAYFANIGRIRMLSSGTGPDTFTVPGQVNVLGNVAANYFIGNGALLSNITLDGIYPLDIRGNVTGNYIDVKNVNLTMFGNIGNVRMEKGNITSSYGNIANVRMENENMHVSGQVNVLGNVTAEYFVGNGALLANVKLIGNQTLDVGGNMHGNYITVSNVTSIRFGNISNVVFSRGNITASIGNIGNVGMEAGNITARGANIGGVEMTQETFDISGQVNVRGNVTAEYFIGDGSGLMTGITVPAPNPLPPSLTIDITGNLIGDNVNVQNIQLANAQVGNITLSAGDINAGQVVVLGNALASDFFGNITSNIGNIGGILLSGGNVSVSGQVNVLGNFVEVIIDGKFVDVFYGGDVVADRFIGDGSRIDNIENNESITPSWLSLGRSTEMRISGGSWSNKVLSTNMDIKIQRIIPSVPDPVKCIPYDPVSGQFTLTAGLSYRITAQMSFESIRLSSSNFRTDLVQFGLYSHALGKLTGGSIAQPIFLVPDFRAKVASCPILDVIIKAEPSVSNSSSSTYDVRCTTSATAVLTEYIVAIGTFITVVSLSSL